MISQIFLFKTQWKARHILTTSAMMLSGANRFAGQQSFITSPLSFRISLLFHRKERKSYFVCPYLPVETVRTN
jgi:hypothetical protein